MKVHFEGKTVDKKLRKSEKILDAALMLFSTQGFYATTIPDIAKAIGWNMDVFKDMTALDTSK